MFLPTGAPNNNSMLASQIAVRTSRVVKDKPPGRTVVQTQQLQATARWVFGTGHPRSRPRTRERP
eukprot:12265931-Prorocentrum_lima.AAC.1